MKTTVLKFFTLSAAIFAFSTISFGQGNTATASGVNAGANIITPIGITNDEGTELQFGDLIATSTEYTVTIDATSGQRAYTGNAAFFTETGYSTADFTVTGEAGAAFKITLPADGTVSLVSKTGTGADMPLTTFASSIGLSSSLSETSGSKTFSVGATLTVGADQTAGEYSATFDVTVAYE